jgi:hypothetical protein
MARALHGVTPLRMATRCPQRQGQELHPCLLCCIVLRPFQNRHLMFRYPESAACSVAPCLPAGSVCTFLCSGVLLPCHDVGVVLAGCCTQYADDGHAVQAMRGSSCCMPLCACLRRRPVSQSPQNTCAIVYTILVWQVLMQLLQACGWLRSWLGVQGGVHVRYGVCIATFQHAYKPCTMEGT